MRPAPHITTFYSYKGGVGRTSAVANLAVLSARAGRSVLVMDADLEAPGLHRYFPKHMPEDAPGVVDLYGALRDALYARFQTPGSFHPTTDAGKAAVRDVVAHALDAPNVAWWRPGPVEGLSLMSAGRFDTSYVERVQTFQWRRFFEDFGEVFFELRTALRDRFDEVYIDARTGLTDISNISTVLFPDTLVAVFTPNHQSLDGAVAVARQAADAHLGYMQDKQSRAPLRVFPLLTRVDASETKLRQEWIRHAATQLTASLGELHAGVDFDAVLHQLHVPYRASYAYGESVAVLDGADDGFGSLAEAYHRIFGALMQERLFSSTTPDLPTPDRALVLQCYPVALPVSESQFQVVARYPAGGPWPTARPPLGDATTWGPIRQGLDEAIHRATDGLRGEVVLFGMMPYSVALLAGRRFDDLARRAAIRVMHLQDGQWQLFTGPGVPVEKDRSKVFRREALTLEAKGDGGDVVLALEGERPIPGPTLAALAQQLGGAEVIRLRPGREGPLKLPVASTRAVREVKAELNRILDRWPGATLHLVSTAPAALIFEVGRMCTPTVYRSVVFHEYQATSGTYQRAIDIIQDVVRA